MIDEFYKIRGDLYFNVRDLENVSNLMNIVRYTVTNSINTTFTAQASKMNCRTLSISTLTNGPNRNNEAQKMAIKNFAPFAGTARIQLMKTSHLNKKMLKQCATQMIPPAWLFEVEDRKLKNTVDVQSIHGFGANRIAYSAVLKESCPELGCKGEERIVVKEYLVKKYTDDELDERIRNYTHQTVCSGIADYLATEFMKSKHSEKYPVTISYVPAGIIRIATKDENDNVNRSRVFNCEKFIKGKWQKFTNNVGDIFVDTVDIGNDKTVLNQLLEFSIFTYEFTDGSMMVADLQGEWVESTKTFNLTDPVINCKNNMIFGNTNMTTIGIKKCLESYRNYLDSGAASDTSGVGTLTALASRVNNLKTN